MITHFETKVIKAMRNRTSAFLICLLFLAFAPFYSRSRQAAAQDRSDAAKDHYLKAQLFFERGDNAQGLAEVRNAIQLDPEFVAAHRLYIARAGVENLKTVDEHKEYVRQHARSAIFRFLLGYAYSIVPPKQQAAADEYQRSLRLDPEYSWSLLELGNQALRKKNTIKATEYFEMARKKAGNDAILRTFLANGLNLPHKYTSAQAEAKRALEIEPACYDAYPALWKAELAAADSPVKKAAATRIPAQGNAAAHH